MAKKPTEEVDTSWLLSQIKSLPEEKRLQATREINDLIKRKAKQQALEDTSLHIELAKLEYNYDEKRRKDFINLARYFFTFLIAISVIISGLLITEKNVHFGALVIISAASFISAPVVKEWIGHFTNSAKDKAERTH